MYSYLSSLLKEKHIDTHAPIALSDTRITRPYLLESAGIREGSAILLAVPYYTAFCMASNRNLSAYAVSRDYHLFFKELFDDILPRLRTRFPGNVFVGFADHSPIDERDAAARAGLGVIGKNQMLITPRYASYVFLGEIITDLHIDAPVKGLSFCEGCDMCTVSCPYRRGESPVCLSALSQKKGALTPEEAALLQKHHCLWGCDICQEVCPHTKYALEAGTLFSEIDFFSQAAIPHLSAERLAAMSEAEFAERAYAWRRRETITRNLSLMEGSHESNETDPTAQEKAGG